MSEMSNDRSDSWHDRTLVLGLFCVMAAIAYVQRAAISVPASEVARDLKFADLARDMGWIQSCWYFGYALGQLPSGWLADRIGSRNGLAILCLLWSVVTFLSSFTADFASLSILWGSMGIAQAGAFPCAAKGIGQIFPDTERARASGLLASGMAIGGAIAPVLTGYMLEALVPLSESLGMQRWRLLLISYSIPGIFWTFIFLMLVPDSRLPYQSHRTTEAEPVDWSRLVRSVPLMLLCLQQFFRAAGMVFFLTWFPTFLQQTRGVSSLKSGILTTIAGIGGVVGSLTGGFVSDWLLARTGNSRLSRQGIAVLGMSTCAVLIVASYAVSDVTSSIALISLGAFCATFGGVSGYTVAINYGGRHVATVFSTMNMCGNLGAALFPIAAGWLVARTGNWNLILLMFAGIMAIDAVCWALLNPRGTLFGTDSPAEPMNFESQEAADDCC